LNLVGLGDRLNHFPAQFSAGEQQRVEIGRAVAKRFFCVTSPTGALITLPASPFSRYSSVSIANMARCHVRSSSTPPPTGARPRVGRGQGEADCVAEVPVPQKGLSSPPHGKARSSNDDRNGPFLAARPAPIRACGLGGASSLVECLRIVVPVGISIPSEVPFGRA